MLWIKAHGDSHFIAVDMIQRKDEQILLLANYSCPRSVEYRLNSHKLSARLGRLLCCLQYTSAVRF